MPKEKNWCHAKRDKLMACQKRQIDSMPKGSNWCHAKRVKLMAYQKGQIGHAKMDHNCVMPKCTNIDKAEWISCQMANSVKSQKQTSLSK